MDPSLEQTFSVQDLYKTTVELDKELRNVLRQKNPFHDEAVILRSRIKTLYEQIVFMDYEFATLKEVEINLWKTVFYKVIEDYRRKLRHISSERTKSSELKRVKNSFRSFLQEAAGFYVSFKQKLATDFQLCLPQTFLNKALLFDIQPESLVAEKTRSKALFSYQQSLIYLGDLARYREMYTDRQQKNWSAAIEYYNEALALVPTNGNPHNQLAVVSSYCGDELGTIYHYYRSLVTSQPFLTAKENIDLLFQRSKKIYDSSPKSSDDGASNGVERSSLRKGNKVDEGAVKGFIKEYIYLHGILHMRADLNSFPAFKDSVISKFRELLDSRSFDADQILEITLINIAALHVFRHYKNNSEDKNTSSTTLQASRNGVLERHLYLLIIEMFQVMMDVGSNVFEVIATKQAEIESSRDRPEFPACVKRILPSARVNVQWIMKNLNLYQLSSTQVRRTAAERDTIRSFWQSFVTFMNHLQVKFGGTVVNQIASMKEDFEIQGFIAIKPEIDISNCSLVRPKLDSQSETKLRAVSMIHDAKKLVELQMVPLAFDPQSPIPFSFDESRVFEEPSKDSVTAEETPRMSDPMAAALASVPDLIRNITSSMYSSSASPGFGYGFKVSQGSSSDEENESLPFGARPRHSKNSIVVGSGRTARSSNSTPYNQSPELTHETFDLHTDAPVGVKALNNNEEPCSANGKAFNLWNQYGPKSVYESRRSSYNNSPSAVGAPLPSVGNSLSGTNVPTQNSSLVNEQFGGYSPFPQPTCSEQYRRETPSGLGILTGIQSKGFGLGGSTSYDKPNVQSSSLFSGSTHSAGNSRTNSFSLLGQHSYIEPNNSNYESSNSLFSESMGMPSFDATTSPVDGQPGKTKSPICPPPGFSTSSYRDHPSDRSRGTGNNDSYFGYPPYRSSSLDAQSHYFNGILNSGVATTDQYR
ncbi:hypothetical protein K7432_003684 [Basidiobolus ranarum]|uniref:Telomerase activating protein Est1 n=1 Tax=Basidiobolus ranarum TaxID=34480 RepID=A0ABR2WZD6_9FUNG